MSAKWRLTVHPILGYQGEKGGGGKCPPFVFLEVANIHHYAFVKGAIILPCQLLGGQMSTHAIFHRGQMYGGEMSGSRRVYSESYEILTNFKKSHKINFFQTFVSWEPK